MMPSYYTSKLNTIRKKQTKTLDQNAPTIISGCLLLVRLYELLSFSFIHSYIVPTFLDSMYYFYKQDKSSKNTETFTASFSWIILSCHSLLCLLFIIRVIWGSQVEESVYFLVQTWTWKELRA